MDRAENSQGGCLERQSEQQQQQQQQQQQRQQEIHGAHLASGPAPTSSGASIGMLAGARCSTAAAYGGEGHLDARAVARDAGGSDCGGVSSFLHAPRPSSLIDSAELQSAGRRQNRSLSGGGGGGGGGERSIPIIPPAAAAAPAFHLGNTGVAGGALAPQIRQRLAVGAGGSVGSVVVGGSSGGGGFRGSLVVGPERAPPFEAAAGRWNEMIQRGRNSAAAGEEAEAARTEGGQGCRRHTRLPSMSHLLGNVRVHELSAAAVAGPRGPAFRTGRNDDAPLSFDAWSGVGIVGIGGSGGAMQSPSSTGQPIIGGGDGSSGEGGQLHPKLEQAQQTYQQQLLRQQQQQRQQEHQQLRQHQLQQQPWQQQQQWQQQQRRQQQQRSYLASALAHPQEPSAEVAPAVEGSETAAQTAWGQQDGGEGDQLSWSALRPEASRKRPRPGSVGGGGKAGSNPIDAVTIPGGASGGETGSDSWRQGARSAAAGSWTGFGAPRQDICCKEGCTEPAAAAAAMVEGAGAGLPAALFCRRHAGAGLALPPPLLSPRPGVLPSAVPPSLSPPSPIPASFSSSPSAFPVSGSRESLSAAQPSPERQHRTSQPVDLHGGSGGGSASSSASRSGFSTSPLRTGGGGSTAAGSGAAAAGGATVGSFGSAGAGDTRACGGGRCEAPWCGTQPRYAEHGAVRPRFCGLHKLPGQMNIVRRCCKHPECGKVPHFGNDQERPLYCGQHKLAGMVNVANRRCDAPGCQRQPTYGNKGDKKPRFCSMHKQEGMFDVIARRCEHEGCMTRAAFNFQGQKIVRFCATHKEKGMENLKNKCCEAEGCKKYRVYGFDGKPAVCCSTHKKPGMVDVRSSRCEFDKCFLHPSFGYVWEKKRRFCGRHKLADMTDVRSRNQKAGAAAAAAAAASAQAGRGAGAAAPAGALRGGRGGGGRGRRGRRGVEGRGGGSRAAVPGPAPTAATAGRGGARQRRPAAVAAEETLSNTPAAAGGRGSGGETLQAGDTAWGRADAAVPEADVSRRDPWIKPAASPPRGEVEGGNGGGGDGNGGGGGSCSGSDGSSPAAASAASGSAASLIASASAGGGGGGGGSGSGREIRKRGRPAGKKGKRCGSTPTTLE